MDCVAAPHSSCWPQDTKGTKAKGFNISLKKSGVFQKIVGSCCDYRDKHEEDVTVTSLGRPYVFFEMILGPWLAKRT